MSVMVIDELTLVKIKNSLVEIEVVCLGHKIDNSVYDLWVKSVEDKYRAIVKHYHEINVLNYYVRYKDNHDVNCEYYNINFELTKETLGFGLLDALGSLRYNISDYFYSRDMDDLIRRFKGYLISGKIKE